MGRRLCGARLGEPKHRIGSRFLASKESLHNGFPSLHPLPKATPILLAPNTPFVLASFYLQLVESSDKLTITEKTTCPTVNLAFNKIWNKQIHR